MFEVKVDAQCGECRASIVFPANDVFGDPDWKDLSYCPAEYWQKGQVDRTKCTILRWKGLVMQTDIVDQTTQAEQLSGWQISLILKPEGR